MLTLQTKNSKAHGNAIIVCQVEPSSQSMKDYLKGRPLWLVETDFGNRMKLTDSEIDEMFHRSKAPTDYEQWKHDRAELRQQNQIEDLGL